jgi:hypothetical protein
MQKVMYTQLIRTLRIGRRTVTKRRFSPSIYERKEVVLG